jgi:hypothetical protein
MKANTEKNKIELELSIQKLYSVFSRYPLKEIKYCSHCITKEENDELMHNNLNQIPTEKINRYIFKAITTWGDINDFKHFIPRIFELFAFDGKDFFHYDTIFDKLKYCGWENWQDNERKAIQEFSLSIWKYNIDSYPPLVSPEILIWIFVEHVKNLEVYLEYWKNSNSIYSIYNLASFICEDFEYLINTQGEDQIIIDGKVTINKWLVSNNFIDKIEAKFFECENELISQELSKAIEFIRFISFN